MPSTPKSATRPDKRPLIGDIITPAEVVSLYVDNGLSLGDIAGRLHCTEGRIGQIIKRTTGMTPAQNRAAAGWVSPRIPPWTSRRIEQVYRAHPDWPAPLIAREANVPAATVNHVLHAAVLTETESRQRKTRLLSARLPVADDELVRLYVNERHTTVELGARFGVDPKTVGRHLQRLNVTLRPKGGGAPPLPEGVTLEDIRRLYVDDRLSLTTVAERLNINPNRVQAILTDGGHPIRTRTGQPLNADTVVNLYANERWPVHQIAANQGVAARRVLAILNDRKVPLRAPFERGRVTGPTPIPGVSIEELRRLYFDENLSLEAVGARVNASKDRVGALLHEAGYTLRPNPVRTRGPNPINKDEAIHAYVTLGWSINKIAATQHVGRVRIRETLIEAGVTLQPWQPPTSP